MTDTYCIDYDDNDDDENGDDNGYDDVKQQRWWRCHVFFQ